MGKYIKRLSNKEIEEFFIANGYQLCKDLKDKNGNPLEAIERSDDVIFVRARQSHENEIDTGLAYSLAKEHPGFLSFAILASLNSGFSRNIDLIQISDFHLAKFDIFPEDSKSSDELYTAYVQYMASRFHTYKEDFIAHYDSLPKDNMEEDNTL